MIRTIGPLLALWVGASTAFANEPKVLDVMAERVGMGWRIAVTMEHPDEGWDHYADGWEVLDPAGNRLGLRQLHHPHEDEQPFTRSLNSVMVPDGVREVYIRTRCSRDGWGDDLYRVMLDPAG